MAIKNQNFEMYAGNTKEIQVTTSEKNSNKALDLTGATIRWVIKQYVHSKSSLVYKDTSNGIAITNAKKGIFTIRLDPIDTKGFRGSYYHEAELVDIIGNVSTITSGKVVINPSGVAKLE